MNILVGKRASEMFPHGIVGSTENKIHDLNRGVYDPKRLGLFLECGSEECFVQVLDHLLFTRGTVDRLGTALN